MSSKTTMKRDKAQHMEVRGRDHRGVCNSKYNPLNEMSELDIEDT